MSLALKKESRQASDACRAVVLQVCGEFFACVVEWSRVEGHADEQGPWQSGSRIRGAVRRGWQGAVREVVSFGVEINGAEEHRISSRRRGPSRCMVRDQ